jgi:hypothetical protein
MTMKKSLMTAALILISVSAAGQSVATKLMAMSDEQLLARWSKESEQYDKRFALSNCKNTRTPTPGVTLTQCNTTDSSVVSLQRKNGQLTKIQMWPLTHPPTDSSMFIRFVRGTQVGNMGAVGMQLLTESKKSGSACVDEQGVKVCAEHAGGDFSLAVKFQ